jgi:hypothetical protein
MWVSAVCAVKVTADCSAAWVNGSNVNYVDLLYFHGGGGGGQYEVTQLVETLCYKPEGRRFDSWWGHPSGSTAAPSRNSL